MALIQSIFSSVFTIKKYGSWSGPVVIQWHLPVTSASTPLPLAPSYASPYASASITKLAGPFVLYFLVSNIPYIKTPMPYRIEKC